MKPKGLYRCAHCKQVLRRASTTRWVKSYCSRTGRTVHLVRQA